MTWILKELRDVLPDGKEPAVSVEWPLFIEYGGLFLWEAFVTGEAKMDTHPGDARTAVAAFADALPDPRPRNAIQEDSVYSLLGAALLRAGWAVPLSVLQESVLVIAAEPSHSRRTRSARH